MAKENDSSASPGESAECFSADSQNCERVHSGKKYGCSADAGWTSLLLQSYETPHSVEAIETLPSPDQLIVLVTKGEMEIESFSNGTWRRAAYRPGCGGMTARRQNEPLALAVGKSRPASNAASLHSAILFYRRGGRIPPGGSSVSAHSTGRAFFPRPAGFSRGALASRSVEIRRGESLRRICRPVFGEAFTVAAQPLVRTGCGREKSRRDFRPEAPARFGIYGASFRGEFIARRACQRSRIQPFSFRKFIQKGVRRDSASASRPAADEPRRSFTARR